MSITPLSIHQIVDVIQQTLQSSGRVVVSGQQPTATSKKKAPTRQASPKSIERRIRERISALDANDPDRGRKAFRVFIETVLLNELGEELINDAAFYDIIKKVESEMVKNSSIKSAVESAINLLIKN